MGHNAVSVLGLRLNLTDTIETPCIRTTPDQPPDIFRSRGTHLRQMKESPKRKKGALSDTLLSR